MFNINKPAFGTPSTNTTATFFASTPSRFGENFAKLPNTANFGEFNKTMAPNFGTTPFTTTTNNSNSSAAFAPNPFGPSSNGQAIFGSNLFNNSPPQQTNEFFGGPQFNPNEKPSFNFTPKSTGFTFGQSNQPQNVFKQTSGTGLFPSTSNFAAAPQTSPSLPGTIIIKFAPVKLTDTSIVKGVNQTINGRNQCITCMKEYEDKSLEELRWEDYQANRKGPQEKLFFTNATNEPMSMEAPTMNVFPQENNLNKNLFGYKFGPATTTSSNAPPGLFGKSTFGFGNPTNTAQSTTIPNYFGTTNTNTNTNSYQTQSSLFNQQQQQQQQNNQTTNSNIFNRNTPFSNNPTTINNLQQQSSLFPGLNTNTTFSFGNSSPTVTSTAVIGQNNQNLFNTSSLIKPSINTQPSVFNTSYKSAFPGLSNHASTSLNTNTNTNNNNIFKYNPTPPQNIFNNQQQQQQQQFLLQQQQSSPQNQNQYNFSVINQTQNHEQILLMSSSPYGLSDLLNNIKEIDNSIKDSTRATNPNELNTLLKTVKPETKIIHDKLQPIHIFRKADQSMFDGLEAHENLTQQRNPKKLVLKKYSFTSDNSNEEFFCNDLSGIFENMNKMKNLTLPPLPPSSQGEEETVEAATQVDEVENVTEMKENKKEVQHPTGIILTRPEYYTVPPLEELIDYINDEDGACIVQGFTVGRLGYGNVYFPEAFDVSNLNLDELVHFCYKEITIYPDDSKKPAQGEGLNRKAQITLDKVWPYDKKTNMLITDADALTEIDYTDRLRRLCDRQQTKFVDYRPDTGSWVFRVDHFSKYGDQDDDDDDDDYYDDLLINNELLVDAQNEDQLHYLTDDFSKCTLMKSSFFDDICDTDNSLLLSIEPNDKLDYSIDSVTTNGTLSLDIFAEDNDEFQYQDVHSRNLPYKVPLQKSYFSYFKISCDVAGFKGRSFKVGWSKNLQFMTLTHINNIMENSIQINEMKTCDGDSSSMLHQCLEEHLNIQLNNSQYNFNMNVPEFSSIPGFKLLKEQTSNCCAKDNFENDIWQLCSALWGQIQQDDLWDARNIRKTLLTTWLQNVIQKTTVFDCNDNSTIMKYLCLYRIEDAATFAFQQNNMNLSMLISQLPSNLAIRNYLMKQLNIWIDMADLIDPDLLKIYLLIAGLPKVEFTNNKTICIYEKMNWLQVLALYLWYIINPEQTIANGINLYEYSFLNSNEIIRPFPMGHANNEAYDLRFELLKYYSDNTYPIGKVLNPLAHTANILDYRFSWFLLQILESLCYADADINPNMKRFIHLNFAVQLEKMHLWHWAIFILLFIEDVSLKTNAIQEVLGRNIEIENSPEYIKKEQFLIHTLKIPSSWLESAKATLAKHLGKTPLAICYLCYAEKWHEAYHLLMDMLMPNNFFSYDYEFLNKILTPLSHHKHLLPNWEQGGGLILDFARLGIDFKNNYNNTDNDRFRNQSIRFRSRVVNIHARFRDISDLSYIRHVCLASIAGRNWSVLDHLLN